MLNLNEEDILHFSQLKYRIFDLYYNNERVKLFDFSSSLITNLSKSADLCIVSSAPDDAINTILKKHQLQNMFFEIIGINKKGKRYTFQRYLDNYEKIYFVTDTSGDVLEAKNLNISTIAVGWGFHSYRNLSKAKPDFFVNSHQELINIIK